MNAGRELDALVANKVMGIVGVYPHYSTDIAAAWLVVEKMGNWHGFIFILELDRFNKGKWRAGWFEHNWEGPEERCAATEQSAMLAICLAALEAVSYDERRRT